MSKSNPQLVIDSFGLTKSFQTGATTKNRLIPEQFLKTQNFYLKTWKTESVSNTDWGTTFNWVSPQSLNVVSSHFFEITLPALASAAENKYKSAPGMYLIDRIKLLSNGSEVYDLDCKLYMREYLSSLSNEEYLSFVDAYLSPPPRHTVKRYL